MLFKALIAILVSLHILSPSSKQPPQQVIADSSTVSLPEIVYADIAIQHELDNVSIYYFDDNAKNTISINADKNWVPASTVKLFVAMYAFDQAAHGMISLDQEVTIDSKNVAPSESSLAGYAPLYADETVSVYRLVDQMITQSDNTAFNTLLDLLDRREITKYVHDLGLTNSAVAAKLNLNDTQQENEYSTPGYGLNLITANDYAKAFILIKGGRIPGSASLFDILSRQKLNSMIPADLPANVVVAHKTGELDPYYHDGGIIVDPKRNYVLSVFSNLGDPGIVAHVSDLIYSQNIDLVGNNTKREVSKLPNAPLDPLVAGGEPYPNVLAESTQNIKVPQLTASDLGIQASDLSTALDFKKLPPVVIPPGSPYHFLVDWGEAMRVGLNLIPSLRVGADAENQKLKLSEAESLISKGKKDEANKLLSQVDQSLSVIAKEDAVLGNKGLQTSIDQVSETRFTLLKNVLAGASDEGSKVQIIKEIAKEAENTANNVVPNVQEAVGAKDLSQAPVVGQVVSVTETSMTVKTSDGKEVTTAVDPQVKTRDVGQTDVKVESVTSITVGSTVALAGFNSGNDSNPSFILTNIASESANPKPVTVLKVNQDTNTIVITSANGIPTQVDLTPSTIIKGADTTVSLDQVKPGDVVIIHGQPLPASASATLASPSPSGSPATSASNPSSGVVPSLTQATSTPPSATLKPIPGVTAPPLASTKPVQTTAPSSTQKPNQAPVQTKTVAPVAPVKTFAPATTTKPVSTPQVIKGNVIQVIQGAPAKSSPPAPAKPAVSAPTTIAPTTKPK